MFKILVLFTLWYLYMTRPVFAFGFTDWSFLLFVWGAAFFVASAKHALSSQNRSAWIAKIWIWIIERFTGKRLSSYDENVININVDKKSNFYRRMGILGVIFIVIAALNTFVLPILLSNQLFFNQKYRALIGNVADSPFATDVESVSLSQIRIVDEETAKKLADKKIGEMPALASQITMGKLALQRVKDKLYYVAPLEHRGFFQWLTNRAKGSTGYIMVSATNPQDVRLVQEINGQPVHIKYQMNGFLFDFLPRYLYAHGYVNVGMADYSFEVDDNLKPYWVVTLYRNKVGYSGADAVGVLLVNAENGTIEHYNLNNIPAWVDRVQPEDFIHDQIVNWGTYIYGFWNAMFTKAGILRPTSSEMHLIYGGDGLAHWYTGITSGGSDDSTMGFILVNSRTKEAKRYNVAGATESAARKSAEGQVQEKGYRAGYPILYNIYGIPTYIAPLKDKEGLLKLVAFVSVENYNLVGVGPDVESALRNYQQVLANKGNQTVIEGQEKKLTEQRAEVARISSVLNGTTTYCYFMLNGDKRLFVGNAIVMPKLSLVRAGDTVLIKFYDTKDQTIEIEGLETGF